MKIIPPATKTSIDESIIQLKALFLDFDGTIVDILLNERNAITELCYEYNISEEKKIVHIVNSYRKINLETWKRFDLQEISIEDIPRIRFSQMKKLFPKFVDDPIKLNDIYTDSFIRNTRISHDVKYWLLKLKDIGLKLIILTNGIHWIQEQRFKKIKIWDILDGYITSESAGAPKPDPTMYNLAFQKFNLKPKYVWMIGDSESDVLGAESVNLNVCYISNNLNNSLNSISGTLHVSNFSEFAKYVIKLRNEQEFEI
ncbi:MAG: HAD family hydrolase [Candidatus Hodarchaeales archaeon]|jgi:putative hydrolase of the HAD superfamily